MPGLAIALAALVLVVIHPDSPIPVGLFMLAAGVTGLVYASGAGERNSRVLLGVGSGLYAAAGLVALRAPSLASAAFSLGAGLALIASGGLRLVAGLQEPRPKGWAAIMAGGALALVVGAAIVAAGEGFDPGLLTPLLAAALACEGLAQAALGLALRKA